MGLWILLIIAIIVAVLVFMYGGAPAAQKIPSHSSELNRAKSEPTVGAIPENYQPEPSEQTVIGPAPTSESMD